MAFYADTDFILAIIKEDDWLGSNAYKLLKEHEGEIVTSIITVLETIVVLKRSGIKNTPAIIEDILEIADPMYVDEDKLFQAAFYMKDGANPFDAFHAALSNEHTIISSDSIYEELNKKRIQLKNY